MERRLDTSLRRGMEGLGARRLVPEPDPGRFSHGAAGAPGKSAGPEARRFRVSPSQKEVVSRYFGGQYPEVPEN
jgi:hypothetical protein